MICIRCGHKIPINSKRLKYCSKRCSRLYSKAVYRQKHRESLREYARNYRIRIKEGGNLQRATVAVNTITMEYPKKKDGLEKLAKNSLIKRQVSLTCRVCGIEIPTTCKSLQFCSESCAKKSYKKRYFEKHRAEVLAYNRNYRKKKANNKLQKIFTEEKCYFCGSKEELVWHHAEYRPVQKLVRMCDGCHKKLHSLLRYRNTAT